MTSLTSARPPRRLRVAAGAAFLLLVLPACSSGDDASEGAGSGGGGSELSAQLSGDAEVPGPGADGASGTATVTPDMEAGELCFTLEVEGVEEATAAHIHEGAADVAGPVVVPLEAPAEGSVEGCAQAEASVLESIAADPGSFYVNVHNAEFPDGAVRGQLEG